MREVYRSKISQSPTSRLLFPKAAKSLDAKNSEIAMKDRRIQELEKQVEILQAKKKKKVTAEDPNGKFVSVAEVARVSRLAQGPRPRYY